MNKINYFDERELLVRREIETKAPKPKAPKCYPLCMDRKLFARQFQPKT